MKPFITVTKLLSFAPAAVFGHRNVVEFSNSASVPRRSAQNIGLKFTTAIEGRLDVVFGPCDLTNVVAKYHSLASPVISSTWVPDRLVWIVPEDAASHGCLAALHDTEIIGRSSQINIRTPVRKRQSLAAIADPQGAWFDAVEYLNDKNKSTIDAADAKSKDVAIIGAGMSGLFTSLLLSSVGMHNWHIYESSNRTGGRVKTEYFNNTRPDEYQYQEMGAMRFPWNITYDHANVTLPIKDNRLVYQLAGKLNRLNEGGGPLVKFSRWIEDSRNTSLPEELLTPDGLQSTAAVNHNTPARRDNPSARFRLTAEQYKSLATNVYEAHKQAVEQGDFHWSEANYLRYVYKLDANLTDIDTKGAPDTPLWQASPYSDFPFGRTEWLTIDQGLESLPRAFAPFIKDKISYLTPVSGLESDDGGDEKVKIHWQAHNSTTQKALHDFAIVAVPFSNTRIWHPMPKYSSLLSRAMKQLNYAQACKVALMYKTRFWEHLPEPIFGGCRDVSDIPYLGSICYPSYQLNSTGPGVLLASYTNDTICRSVEALDDQEHVRIVQAAMVEIHGQPAEENFVGLHERQLWQTDPHAAGSWASPTVGQQPLFLPAYFKTEHRTIFVGEHTSAVNAWVWSALESAVRGVVQLLLELGLVDEAKAIVQEWMARWIDV